ncbi:MAG: hypothetical protein EBQ83_08455, partial [Burkholderiaceae bacterium]|nr:hypothetical protein [Burkholderiaceae bacterium]
MTQDILQVVYLHGFRSSPNSSKAKLTGAAIQAKIASGAALQWFCPQLPPSPQSAIDLVLDHLINVKPAEVVIIGSSLGGFYANWLAEHLGCRAVALNPAVYAARELAPYVGELTQYDSNEPFDFKAQYIDELKSLQISQITMPERYFLMAAKGDELLDWQEMVHFYANAQQL